MINTAIENSELNKIPFAIRDKYGIEYNPLDKLLTINHPELMTIKTPVAEIEVEVWENGYTIRTERAKVTIGMNTFFTITTIL